MSVEAAIVVIVLAFSPYFIVLGIIFKRGKSQKQEDSEAFSCTQR